ncbi:hypothetical protein [Actinomadura miaoliensis]
MPAAQGRVPRGGRCDAGGGRVVVPARETEDGYAGHFTDLDGFLWKVTAA